MDYLVNVRLNSSLMKSILNFSKNPFEKLNIRMLSVLKQQYLLADKVKREDDKDLKNTVETDKEINFIYEKNRWAS